jgi:hypothetical protein
VTLGAVGAAAGLGLEPTFSLGGVGDVSTGATSPGRPQATAAAGRTPSLVDQLAPKTPATGSAPVLAPTPRGLRGILDGLSAYQVQTLYAVLALGAVTLFVGWRGTVLMRHGLPGGWRRR